MRPSVSSTLPPEFVAVLGETDASIAQMSGTLRRIRGAGLNFSLFSGGKVEETLGRMEQTLGQLQGQVGELRARESLMTLLSFKNTMGNFERDLSSSSTILHNARVRTPSDLDQLNKLLADLDKSSERLGGAMARLDAGALRLMENLDRAAGARQ